MFNYKKKTRDIRFLDAERFKDSVYRRKPVSTTQHSVANQPSEKQALEQNIVVDESLGQNQTSDRSFLQLIQQAASQSYIEGGDDEHILVDRRRDEPAGSEWVNADKTIGVFSDSKIYSALIQSVITPYQLNVGHFNHPDTFSPKKYAYFDEISCWIVFLSDDHESDFIDRFLERYVDKPSLFLVPKMNRETAQASIKKFLSENAYIDQRVADELKSESVK